MTTVINVINTSSEDGEDDGDGGDGGDGGDVARPPHGIILRPQRRILLRRAVHSERSLEVHVFLTVIPHEVCPNPQVYRSICASISSPPLNFRASTSCFFR